MNLFIFPILAGSIGSLSIFQQAIKIFKTTNTRDISLSSFFLLFISAALWVSYGFVINDLFMCVGSSIIIPPSIFIVIYKIKNIILGKETLYDQNIEQV